MAGSWGHIRPEVVRSTEHIWAGRTRAKRFAPPQ
jgi:hypothetical protein